MIPVIKTVKKIPNIKTNKRNPMYNWQILSTTLNFSYKMKKGNNNSLITCIISKVFPAKNNKTKQKRVFKRNYKLNKKKLNKKWRKWWKWRKWRKMRVSLEKKYLKKMTKRN